MKQASTTFKWLLLALVALLSLPTMAAVDGEGKYFTQNFEDQSQFPTDTEGKGTNTELKYNTSDGEWIYYNSFSATNASYTSGGTGMNLRLPKSVSASVTTPVLTNGVNKVTFYLGRGTVTVQTSSDGGTTWATATTTTSGKIVTATIESETVNRIKITNSASKDADIDDLSVYAQSFDQPVTVSTGDAADITKTTATISGQITKEEETVTEVGFVWSNTNKEPTLSDNSMAATLAQNFSITLSELAEGKTYYYRAYAKYGSTQSYGVIKSFKTEAGEQQQTIDTEGRYFIQDFEDQTTYPGAEGKDANTELTFQAFGGEWIYYNSYISTNATYNVNGSTANLRLPKNGTYVITPVLNSGVKKFTWNQMRKTCVAYTSKDGGKTWTSATIATDATDATLRIVEVNDLQVNRIKIANEASGDADIDNLIVYAQAFGTPATVTTGGVESITKNSAVVFGQIVDAGDQPITEKGILWSTTNTQPSLSDNKEESEDLTTNDITIAITGLKASQTVYYCAFALSNAGYAFGETKSFETSPATAAVVTTSDLTKSGSRFRIGGVVTDDGGADITEVGVIYGTTPGLDINNGTKIAAERPSSKFTTSVSLEAGTTYYVRAYAITTFSTEPAYGEEKAFTTDAAVEVPDEIKGDEIWCSPDGDDATADGSAEKPFFDLQKAVDIAQPGDRIWMKAGTYVYDKRININDRNGEADKYIELFVYPKDSKEHAVLDFSGMPYHAHSDNPYQGIRHTSSYWHYYKIDITNASDNGLLIERNKPTGGSASDIINRTQDGHDNIIELCNFYKNGDTGLQMKNLAEYNYIINCDSYLNCDEDNGDADGFAPKISVGDGNYFYGCRAWLNSDDGYDVFFKKTGGFEDNKSIILDYCYATRNGKLENGSPSNGNANGFKMGSDQGRMNVYLNRCVAAANGSKGFDQNHNSGDIIMKNCTGIAITSETGGKNVKEAYSYKIYEALQSGSVCQLINCISIGTTAYESGKDIKASKTGSAYGGIRVDESIASLTTCNMKADPSWFVDLTNYVELEAERNEDGSIPETTFAHLKEDSNNPLIGAGTKNTESLYRGIDVPAIRARFADNPGVNYSEINSDYVPSLGAYEAESNMPTGIGRIESVENNGKAVRLIQCQNGMVILAVNGAKAADEFQVTAYDVTGRTLGQHKFNATGSIFLPAVKGAIILKVTGKGVNEAIKVAMK